VGERPHDPGGLDRRRLPDFDISDNEIEALYAKGYAAAEKFLAGWDWDAYLERFR
jgi:hypothetical protein